MKERKILIIYVDIGKGHYKSANAIKEEFDKIGIESVASDFLRDLPRPYHIFMREGYLKIVKYFPQAYNIAYKFTTRMDREEARVYANIVTLSVYPFIERVYEKYKPEIVVSTHPITTLAFGYLKGKKYPDLKVIGVITDYHIINFFLARELDFVVCPHEDVVNDYIRENGSSSAELLPYGIPVSSKFKTDILREEAKEILGLQNEKHIVLVMAGGLGLPQVVEVAESISAENFKEPVSIFCLGGKNHHTLEKIREIEKTKSRKNKIYYMDWTDDVWIYMKAASIIISKAGGSTIAEACCASLPFIVYKPLPGQEYINTNFLLKHHAALYTNKKEKLKEFVQKVLFEEEGKNLSDNIAKLAKPNASFDVVNKVIRDYLK